ncbi:hypothetical protein GCK32_022625 [Trichostrongylus colubriformis]|uniref:Uncharacterized protein n=1 Tax=Trichostrongylus colubriformis TaxID=6319 RepID=A0AAN8FRJ3_TRICO
MNVIHSKTCVGVIHKVFLLTGTLQTRECGTLQRALNCLNFILFENGPPKARAIQNPVVLSLFVPPDTVFVAFSLRDTYGSKNMLRRGGVE